MAEATIVFCDISGFSRHNDTELRTLVYSLNVAVRDELSEIISSPSVVCLPTGDGMAIAFLDKDPGEWAPELFALIDRLVRWAKHNSKLRIGVHTGGVSVIADINKRPNICGTTINDAQRIMDAAHPGQVLFSADAYRRNVGPRSESYLSHPFSKQQPARFKGPINIIVKHGFPFSVHIMYRDGDSDWETTEPYPDTFYDKLSRTQFIENQLKKLVERTKHKLFIYEQSAFSTFGICDDHNEPGNHAREHLWSNQPEYGKEYRRARIQQRKLFEDLARQKRTTLKLIIYPKVPAPHRCARLRRLLKWMEEVKKNPRIDFVVATEGSVNRLIVKGEFSIDGFKIHNTSGYELSIVHRDEGDIAKAISDFDRVFDQAREQGSTKEAAIMYVKCALKDLCPKSRSGQSAPR
ncbi:MAG TPA: adenylate/guanylate cyclase domain-containing protein [Bryobacteraceae bacterium]|nr:adenylate/guanylate cyclase domain-containing protein [Bryobacteraceae bacterium]